MVPVLAAVLAITAEQGTAKSQLTSASDSYAKQAFVEFITGQKDASDDAVWAEYVENLKSQCENDFDEVIAMLNENSVVEE